MAIQQMLLGVGGKTYGDSITIGGTTTDLTTANVNVTGNGFYLLTVPEDGAKFKLHLWGAGGGNGAYSTPAKGGAGGYAYGEFRLDQGNYSLLIGKHGVYDDAGNGPFPDGGRAPDWGGSGGGSSRLATQEYNNVAGSYNASTATYLLIAGGGGGGADHAGSDTVGSNRGEGGGTTGGDGGFYYFADTSTSPGKGGSQSAGGAGGTNGRLSGGEAGSKYQGGHCGSGAGGGGGGGYYGGGSASGYYSQGGGGSGYLSSEAGNGVLQGGGTLISGGSYNYYEAYHGPNNEQPGNAGDAEEDGLAVFSQL